MNLVIVDAKHVESETEEGGRYNSNFHTEAEAPGLQIPELKPYSYKRWLPLIAQSRGISTSSAQIITISPSQGRLIVSASRASQYTRVLNRVYAEDLKDSLEPTLSSLVFPAEGLFLRCMYILGVYLPQLQYLRRSKKLASLRTRCPPLDQVSLTAKPSSGCLFT